MSTGLFLLVISIVGLLALWADWYFNLRSQ